jgi:hypothetical protein
MYEIFMCRGEKFLCKCTYLYKYRLIISVQFVLSRYFLCVHKEKEQFFLDVRCFIHNKHKLIILLTTNAIYFQH